MSGIYKIESKQTSQVYIGSSLNVDKRIKSHKSLLQRGKHRNHRLQQHWNLYGATDLEFSVIEYVDENILDIRESYFICKYDSFNNGFNLTLQTNRLETKPTKLAARLPIIEVHTNVLTIKNFNHTHAVIHAYMMHGFNEAKEKLEPYCESYQSIADELAVSKRTVIKVIDELESEYLIVRIPVRIKKSTCNSYIVIKP